MNVEVLPTRGLLIQIRTLPTALVEGKNMSGAFRTFGDRVRFKFVWPNEYVSWMDGDHPAYDNLTFPELVVGVFKGLEVKLPNILDNRFIKDQVSYYAKMFAEAPGTSYSTTIKAHRQVLNSIEKKEIDPNNW